MANYDVIILGGGPAGYVCAIRCAQLGLSTAVIEREGLGGTCVLWGCIPAKAMLESAHLALKVGHAAEHGINVGEVKLDFGPAMKRSRAVSTQNTKGVEFLFKKHKVTWIRGEGTLQKNKRVSVKSSDGKTETHDAKKAVVIATGSRVRGLPQAGLELDKSVVLSSDDVLVLEKAPKTMAVVGAGAVGCEFADVFAAFGTKITLIEMAPNVLPLEDAECSAEVARSFKKRKMDVLVSAKLTSAKVTKTGATLTVEATGMTNTIEAEKVLVATGRAPNVDGIGLEAVGIAKSDRGFIKINEKFETSVPGYYAVGDVAGNQMLAHKGQREGHVLADMLGGEKTHPVNYGNVPSCTYCHPEVASVGLTEQACKDQKLDYKVGKFPFSANGRARTSGETEGFVKIIRDAKYGEILGAHIVGAHATEIIHELVVARENEFTVEEIDLAIHAHPTLSEAIGEAVLDSMGKLFMPDAGKHEGLITRSLSDEPVRIVAPDCGRVLHVLDLGLTPYDDAWLLQKEAARMRMTGELAHDLLILCEHPPVVTLGRSSKAHHLLASPDFLAVQGIDLRSVERGGDVTIHEPGQLVGYPIIDLKQHKQDLHWYLRQIEEAIILTCTNFGIEATRRAGLTGVWVEDRKLASIGVHARDWVTWHGFALNVHNTLATFAHVVPCGIDGVAMTTMTHEHRHVAIDIVAVTPPVITSFCDVFQFAAFKLQSGREIVSIASLTS